MENKDEEIRKIKNLLKLKTDENANMRALSQMILDQRSDTEQFFIECLEDVKMEIFKKKKEAEQKASIFSNLTRKYHENILFSKKIDLKELIPEDKEKVIRLLFAKINENYKPKTYRDYD